MTTEKSPSWVTSPVKWMEDDALTPDRETMREAWRRIYGVELAGEVLVEVYDGGDTGASLYESGRIAVNSCGLCEIRELPPGDERPRRGATIHKISDR